MVKDVVVNLSVVEGRDPACDYALSVAHDFNAHLAGIAFAYDPVLAIAGEAMPPKWIEEQHAKAAEAADAAVAKFEEGARRVGLSAESRVLNATVGEGPELFGLPTAAGDQQVPVLGRVHAPDDVGDRVVVEVGA